MQYIKSRRLHDLRRSVRLDGRRPARRGRARASASRCRTRRVLIHQPWGGTQGQVTDIEIQAKEMLRMRDELDGSSPSTPARPIEKIHLDTERDNIMSAEDAKAYGLVDDVFVHRGEEAK